MLGAAGLIKLLGAMAHGLSAGADGGFCKGADACWQQKPGNQFAIVSGLGLGGASAPRCNSSKLKLFGTSSSPEKHAAKGR